jgi:hypothetical protein
MRTILCFMSGGLALLLSGCCINFFPAEPRRLIADAGVDAGVEPVAVDDRPVIEPARPPPAISGGTLAVLADGTIVIADSDRDLVYLVGTDDAVRTVSLEANDEPGRVSAGPPGRAFVALRRAAKVVELDVASGTIVARHPVCASPRGVTWSAEKKVLFVACAGGELTQLGFENGLLTATRTRRLYEDLRDVIAIENGVLFTTFRDTRLRKFVGDTSISLLASPEGVTIRNPQSEDDGKVFIPHVAWRTVSTPSGVVVMVHQRAQLTSLVPASAQAVDAPAPVAAYGSSGPAALTPSLGSVHSVVTVIKDGQAEEKVIRKAVLPVDVAVSADATTIVVASVAEGVIRLTGSEQQTLLANTLGSFTAVGFRGTSVVAFSREPAQLVIRSESAALKVVSLSKISVASTGHDLFHGSTANTISCASCHPEGGEDGHVWSLPEGLRRTPSLRGGLIGTEPFHWSGNHASMTSLLSDVFVKRMGGVPQSEERAQAQLQWLDAQPKLAAPGLDAAAIERGRVLFESPQIGCASCHSGSLGTNNATADVGTQDPFQVPRLVELAYRAPFFHDGRVTTLAARFTPVGGGDLHGHVSGLTAPEVDDLVTYLRSR